DAVDKVRRRTGRGEERIAEPYDRSERAVRIRRAELDVAPGPDLALEIADRSAKELRPEVESEHERSVGNGLEEDCSVARSPRIVLDLANEAGVDERLERQRNGWLRDVGASRDLGARDGCVRAQDLEYGLLVEVLEQPRRGSTGPLWLAPHLVSDL